MVYQYVYITESPLKNNLPSENMNEPWSQHSTLQNFGQDLNVNVPLILLSTNKHISS